MMFGEEVVRLHDHPIHSSPIVTKLKVMNSGNFAYYFYFGQGKTTRDIERTYLCHQRFERVCEDRNSLNVV